MPVKVHQVKTEPFDILRAEKKTIILTSFRDAQKYNGINVFKYSISRWQPHNTKYSELKSLAPFYRDGRPIKSLPPDMYRLMYEREVLSNPTAKRQLQAIIDLMGDGDTSVLMCWCNPARQEEYSKLFCHRVLVGWFIEENFPHVKIVYADGADNPIWER